MNVSAAVDAGPSVVLWLSLWASVARGASTGTVDCCLWSTSVRFLCFPCPPLGRRRHDEVKVSGGTVMDIVHERAAGLDISKRDAKVCLRLPGQRAGTYTSTVTTWGAT